MMVQRYCTSTNQMIFTGPGMNVTAEGYVWACHGPSRDAVDECSQTLSEWS